MINEQPQQTRFESEIAVLAVGSKVLIGQGIEATVVDIQISAGRYIRYHCAWWTDATRTTAWLEESEVTTETPDETRIGFRSGIE